ncbi:unnamed protein product [Callosobruchus maculatus]|uniref:Uncharacterized protein n=1 Tax=Callosobruchus maculatus TaxID=64391 RepID=A0A653DTJ4_CALMS|nr:unnamed protein product [Callosobruchus maculatus]
MTLSVSHGDLLKPKDLPQMREVWQVFKKKKGRNTDSINYYFLIFILYFFIKSWQKNRCAMSKNRR